MLKPSSPDDAYMGKVNVFGSKINLLGLGIYNFTIKIF